MGFGINLLSRGGAASANIYMQTAEPSAVKGLWIKSAIQPDAAVTLFEDEIEREFASAWESFALGTAYNTFAAVGDTGYLIGKADGTYCVSDLTQSTPVWTSHSSGTNMLFTSTAVIGSKIYAVYDGSDLVVYEMDTDSETPVFSQVLPTVSSCLNPRICAYGSKLYALRGGTGSSALRVIDTAAGSPEWSDLAAFSEDTSKCSLMVNGDFLYVVGVATSYLKCYALDLTDASDTLQVANPFTTAGTNYPALSNVGGLLRVINCGYATTDRNCLTMANGVWAKPDQTGLTLLTATLTSYANAYHTDNALYFKGRSVDSLYRLKREFPELGLNDNTLIIVKGNGASRPEMAKLGSYTLKESVSACYLFNIVDEKEVLTKLDIAWYDPVEEDWIDV